MIYDGAAKVLAFWRDAGPERWFDKNAEFDADFHDQFRELHFAAARQEFSHWLNSPQEALALLLLLDQFPRNCFRGTAHMFATDYLALHCARWAVETGLDSEVEEALRVFFYLPFMHAENLADQELCCKLCEPLGGNSLEYAIIHRDIIARFGRFPHRNAILLRESTAAEEAFLAEGGFAG